MTSAYTSPGQAFVVRCWQKKDLKKIREIALHTWLETYSTYVPENDIILCHKQNYNDLTLAKIFRERYGFVAEVDNQVIAYSTASIIPLKNRYMVHSLYVLPQYQSRGMGKSLLRCQLDQTRKLGHDRIWLGVMEKNTQSLNWYVAMGFNFIEADVFYMGKSALNTLIGYQLVSSDLS